MKYMFILLILSSFLHSDEIQRVEMILKDISKLRQEYNECRDELKNRKENSIVIKEKIDYKNNEELIKKVNKLEKEIKTQEILLKTKETRIQNLNKMEKNNKKTESISKICEEENKFPKLMMKEEYNK